MNAVPAHILARRSGSIASRAAANVGGVRPPHISIADNRFTLVDANGNSPYPPSLSVDVVVVDANENKSKRYYRDAFKGAGGDNGPPTCWSDNGVGPSKDAPEPQASSCAICPHNQWGSATSKMTGQPIRACGDMKKIAVLYPGVQFPLLLIVPPASLKGFGAYVRNVGAINLGDRPADLADVVTRVSFESQGILKFEAVGYAPEESVVLLDQLLEGTKLDEIVGRTDEPRTEALPPPAAAAPLAAPQQPLPPSQQHFPTGAPLPPQGFQAPPQTGQWAPAPAPAFAPAPNGFAGPAVAPPVNSFGTPASPTPATTGFAQPASPEPPKRTRRTKAQIEADKAAKEGEVLPPSDPGPANPIEIPAFLKSQVPPQPQYGFTQPMAAPPDMQAALDAAMGALPPG